MRAPVDVVRPRSKTLGLSPGAPIHAELHVPVVRCCTTLYKQELYAAAARVNATDASETCIKQSANQSISYLQHTTLGGLTTRNLWPYCESCMRPLEPSIALHTMVHWRTHYKPELMNAAFLQYFVVSAAKPSNRSIYHNFRRACA